jgi:hypothetical protein
VRGRPSRSCGDCPRGPSSARYRSHHTLREAILLRHLRSRARGCMVEAVDAATYLGELCRDLIASVQEGYHSGSSKRPIRAVQPPSREHNGPKRTFAQSVASDYRDCSRSRRGGAGRPDGRTGVDAAGTAHAYCGAEFVGTYPLASFTGAGVGQNCAAFRKRRIGLSEAFRLQGRKSPPFTTIRAVESPGGAAGGEPALNRSRLRAEKFIG